jgi:hypothetical protein
MRWTQRPGSPVSLFPGPAEPPIPCPFCLYCPLCHLCHLCLPSLVILSHHDP